MPRVTTDLLLQLPCLRILSLKPRDACGPLRLNVIKDSATRRRPVQQSLGTAAYRRCLNLFNIIIPLRRFHLAAR